LYICHVITTIERGDAENAVLALAREQVRRGYMVEIVPIKGSLDLEQEMLATGIVVNKNLLNKNLLVQIFRLQKVIGRKSIDLVHAHLPRAEIICRLVLLGGQTKPFFVTRHNAEPFLKRRFLGASSIVSRWVVGKSSAIIAISEEVAKYLDFSQELAKRSITQVIYYGYQRRYSEANPHMTRKQSPNSGFELVTISRLTAQKNLKFAINLIGALNESQIRARLTIVGSGPLEFALKEYTSQMGLSDVVIYVGKTKDVFSALKGKDLFLMTSNYEGFGLAVLEAIDFGLPVCAPGHSAFLEVLGSTDLGLYAPNSAQSLFSKVQQLLTDPDLAQQLKKGQQQRLDLFSIEKYFYAHHETYRLGSTPNV